MDEEGSGLMDYVPHRGVTAEGCCVDRVEKTVKCNDGDAQDCEKPVGKLDEEGQRYHAAA